MEYHWNDPRSALDKTVAIYILFGERLPEEVMFSVGKKLRALEPDHMRVIRAALYPSRGIYFGDLELIACHGSLYLPSLVARRIERLATTLPLDGLDCELYEARNRHGAPLRLDFVDLCRRFPPSPVTRK